MYALVEVTIEASAGAEIERAHELNLNGDRPDFETEKGSCRTFVDLSGIVRVRRQADLIASLEGFAHLKEARIVFAQRRKDLEAESKPSRRH